jgi:hypothetical protein
VIGGISAGLSTPGEAVASVAGRFRRLADWTAAQSLGPTSVSGVSLALGIVAAVWFTAGTRPDNINGAIALAACYLAALGARELASQVTHRLADHQRAGHPQAGHQAGSHQPGSGVSQPGGATSRRAASRLDRAVRSGWLAVLGVRLSDCVIYAGLAVGAIVQGWTGIWPLAMGVLALTAIRDTMTACSSLTFPAPVPAAPVPADSVFAGSPSAGSPSAGSPSAGPPSAASASAGWDHQDGAQAASARTGSAQTRSAQVDAADADSAPLDQVRDHPVSRAVAAVLTMPFGGRVLLIAVAAPVWGARASLLGLLDWAIIAVCYGIGSGTVARRRVRKPRRRPQRRPQRRVQRRVRRPQAEPGVLAVALQPPRPDPTEFQTLRPAGQPISVLRMQLSPAPPGVGQGAEPSPVEPGSAEPDAAEPSLADSSLADSSLAEPRTARTGSAGGLADIGLGGIGLADAQPAGTGFADTEFPFDSSADTWFTGHEPASNGFTGPNGVGDDHAGNGFAGNGFSSNGVAGNGFAGGADVGGADGGGADGGGEFAISGAQGAAQADAGAGGDSSEARSRAVVLHCRDDGAISRWFGRLVRGQLMPLPPALLALAAVTELAHLGLRDLPGLLVLAPAIVMLVAAPGSSHPHGGRFDWLVPAVLQGAQYIYIAALGFATGVPPGLTFLLCGAIALRYADLGSPGSPALAARRRAITAVPVLAADGAATSPAATGQAASGPAAAGQAAAGQANPRQADRRQADRRQTDERLTGRAQAVPERGAWMGWEGRMLIVGLGAATGITMFAFAVLAAYVAGLVGWKILASGLDLREGDRW